MQLKKTFAAISEKIDEARKQKTEIIQKLDANKSEKAKAVSAKATALEAKDEKAYKAACMAIADADAGIEFNNICLNHFQKKKFATESEDTQIKHELRQGVKEIYVNAILQIEKLENEIRSISESALKELNKIDSLVDSWDKEIMKNPSLSIFSDSRSFSLNRIYNGAVTRITQLESSKQNDSFFNERS